ncbi:MAG TPA: phosphoglycerate dehydrogenase [Alphaproteobacteria bacterium]|nr:phosphoglycerate dehydrogenase [Rhodospirillaceae bacterium]HRJ12262.1 phosphoglycerate dehydrogenase [Alphaproteobacteria bacterium]
MKVLIADKMSERAEEILYGRGIAVDVQTGLDADALKKIIENYDALLVRSSTRVTADIMAAAKKLKVIGRAGIGVDNIDVPAATTRGIVVMNTPHGNSVTTAEHTLAMMFASARHIPAADVTTQAGKWEKNKYTGIELYGKVLGIIGCGNIGALVAERALALKLKVITYDPFLSDEKSKQLGVGKVTLDELFAQSDIITLHVPLNEQTRNIINKDSLAKCKKGVRIVNCARGGLIDEVALKKAMDDGHVAGAALDVFTDEPALQNVLFGTPHVICTPHLGASTVEAQENVALQVAEQVSDFLLSGAVAHAVNMPALSAEDALRLRPYLRLATDMGAFVGQLMQGDLQHIKIEYSGDIAALRVAPVTTVALQALLSTHMESVNVVNAQMRAQERGIKVEEVRVNDETDYRSLIKLSVTTSNGTRNITGTIFAQTSPRLIEVDGIPVEATPAQHMLFIRNEDKPGLVGTVGQTLAQNKINIASFHLGRAVVGGEAIALVAIDQPASSDVVKQLAKLPLMLEVQALHFAA